MKGVRKQERDFRITFLVSESKVGGVMADLEMNHTVRELGFGLVREMRTGKNLPRGAFYEAVVNELAGNRNLTCTVLRAILVEKGFTKGTIYSSLAKLLKDKKLIKKGQTIRLPSSRNPMKKGK